MLKRQTSEQTHMNIKLFIPEPLRKIFASPELLKYPYLNKQAMHTIILTQLQSQNQAHSQWSAHCLDSLCPRWHCVFPGATVAINAIKVKDFTVQFERFRKK